MKNNRSGKGFTLVELMVVVAILGVITAIAYPSYVEFVRKSNRSEAKAELSDVAQRLQRCYTTYAAYNDNRCPIYADLVDDGLISQGRGFYKVTISSATRTTYTLTATAIVAPQTADTNNGCNAMTLNYQGVRSPAVCW